VFLPQMARNHDLAFGREGCCRHALYLTSLVRQIGAPPPRDAGLNGFRRVSANEFPNSCRLLRSNAATLQQRLDVCGDHALHGAKLVQQSRRECRTHARQSLEHENSSRCQALRLSVVPPKSGLTRLAGRFRQKPRDPQ
jgi:hypothetical protein